MKPTSIADKLAEFWQGGESELAELYYGKGRLGEEGFIPDADDRQRELVGRSIDTALETVLFFKIKSKSDVDALVGDQLLDAKGREEVARFYHDNPTPSDEHVFQLIADLRKQEMIATHTQYATPQDLDDYVQSVFEFRASYKDKVKQLAESMDGLAEQPRPETGVPADPAVLHFNERFKDILFFRDTGPKNSNRTLVKAAEEKKGAVWKVKDINRITVVPESPEVAEVYAKLLREQSQRKDDGKPRYADTDWKLTETLCLDRKCYVVLDQDFKSDVLKGTVGEIKIEGPAFLEADINSHYGYRLIRLLQTDGVFQPSSLIQEFQTAKSWLLKADTRLASLPNRVADVMRHYRKIPDLEFPSLPSLEKMDEATLTKIASAAMALNQQLFIAGVREMAPDDGWKRLWLEKIYEKIATFGSAACVSQTVIDPLTEGMKDPPSLEKAKEKIRRNSAAQERQAG